MSKKEEKILPGPGRLTACMKIQLLSQEESTDRTPKQSGVEGPESFSLNSGH